MCLLCDHCLVMLCCFMLRILILVHLCVCTCSMHNVVRHALVHSLISRRVRVMCTIIFNLLIRRVKVTHVLALDLLIHRVRVMHVLILELLIHRVKVRCILIPDLLIWRVKISWELRVLFSNVSVVLRLINKCECLVARRTGIGVTVRT